MLSTPPSRPASFADFLFLLLCAAFCLVCLRGSMIMTPDGCGLDSDLQNYAQIAEAGRHPELFAHDPVAPLLPQDPGAPNIVTWLADMLPGTGQAALDFLQAGAVLLFFHLALWYLAGRVLFKSRTLAAFLSILMAVTVYWAYGTFWGAFQSDPVPRAGYAALWAPLFLLACLALERGSLRLVLMVLVGLSLWIHSVSALMTAAMFLTAFLVTPLPPRWKISAGARTLTSLVLSTACFLVPFALFLTQRVSQPALTPEEADLFRQIHAVRFAADLATPWQSLFQWMSLYIVQTPILPAGFIAAIWLILRRERLDRMQRLGLRLIVGCFLGIVLACLLVYGELALASRAGSVGLGLELLRGTRFLIPLSWLSILLLVCPVWKRLPCFLRLLLPAAFLVVLCLVSQEKQILAFRTGLADLGVPYAESAEAESQRAANVLAAEAMERVRALVPADELVFSPENALAVRYAARRALSPVHKDGNVIYYSRQVDMGRRWLTEQTALAAGSGTILKVWLANGSPWLLTSRTQIADELRMAGDIVHANAGWLLVRRR